MATKPKTLLKNAKGKKRKEQTLDDADDYLAAAIDDEDAMGKHRGGDGAKALRFSRRALNLYEQGLAKYPQNFDMAYNKARLELEIATHPILVKHLDVPVMQVLRQALASHQFALGLDSMNADLLFNAAQVLTAIAEYMAKNDDTSNAVACLGQALEYQQQCLSLQQDKFAENQRLMQEAAKRFQEDDDDDGGAKIDAHTATAYEERAEEEQWVSVVEPVTASTLLDTMLAQLGTLTTLCSVMNSSFGMLPSSPSASLPWIEKYSNEILTGTLPDVVNAHAEELSKRTPELELTKANFAANFLELAFRASSIDLNQYKQLLEGAFEPPVGTERDNSPDVHMAYARALISFNNAIAETVSSSMSDGAEAASTLRWNALSKAQKALTLAAGLPLENSELAMTHLLRGDISLLLLSLAWPPAYYQQAISNSTQLFRNAQVYYRNAGKLSQDDRDSALLRAAVAEILQQGAADTSGRHPTTTSNIYTESVLRNAVPEKGTEWIKEQIQDMIDDGLVQPTTFDL